MIESSSYGDLIEANPMLATRIESHEWDNKNVGEQRDWLLTQFKTLTKENEELRTSVKNQTGDNLCHLTEDVDLGKIPPWEEFSVSCFRYHSQIAGTRGTLIGGMTIAQLEAESVRQKERVRILVGEIETLRHLTKSKYYGAGEEWEAGWKWGLKDALNLFDKQMRKPGMCDDCEEAEKPYSGRRPSSYYCAKHR